MQKPWELSLCLSVRKTKFAPLFFSGDLEKGISKAAEIGYQRVEIGILDSQKIDQDWIKSLLVEYRMKTHTIATGQGYVEEGLALFGEKPESRKGAVTRLKGHIDFAVRLGAKVIIGGIRGKLPAEFSQREKAYKAGIEGLRECCLYAKERGVDLYLEAINRYETNCFNTLHETCEAIDKVAMDNLKLLADTFHMNIEEADIASSIIDAKDHLGYIHFADSNRNIPGKGHTDFHSVMEALAKIDYSGVIGIEALPVPEDLLAATQAFSYMKHLLGLGGKR